MTDSIINHYGTAQVQRTVTIYIMLTPLLWALGAMIPAGVALLFWTLFMRGRLVSIIDSLILSWWTVAGAQALSVLFNWANAGNSVVDLLYRLVSAVVIGWVFMGLALSAGRAYHLASERVAHGVCILGSYFLFFGLVSIGISRLSNAQYLNVLSPVGYLFPRWLPSTLNYFTMRFYIIQHTFGLSLPRLILFYPWSEALGFAGIAVFFISLNDTKPIWKALGTIGGIFAVLGSMSRAAAVSFFISFILYIWLRANAGVRWLTVCAVSVVMTLLVAYGFLFHNYIGRSYTEIMAIRQGSSDARRMAYKATWHAFQTSPLLGYGWPGDYLSEHIPIRLGTHSTLYGTLYTGGALTFISLCFALGLTFFLVIFTSHCPSKIKRSSICILVTTLIMSYGEGICSFIVPCLFAFLWIGGALARE